MKKAKKSKKEVAKTTNVDVELTENELDTVSGGGRTPNPNNPNPNPNPIEEVLKPLTTIPEN